MDHSIQPLLELLVGLHDRDYLIPIKISVMSWLLASDDKFIPYFLIILN